MNITEKAKELRKVLKTRFPDCKFSVISDYNSLRVALMSSFVEFEGETYQQGLNYHYHRQFEHGSNEYILCQQIMETILEILPQYEIDDNPDYGSIPNYYLRFDLGKWDKPYMQMRERSKLKAA